MKVETLKIYPDREDVTLTGYIVGDSPELLNGKARPAVLICPGGGPVAAQPGRRQMGASGGGVAGKTLCP